jgi:integrase
VASVAKRPDGRWRARYRDAAGQEHARHFPRKIDAQRWLDEVTAAVVTGQYVDPRAGRITVEEYAARWAASQPWRPKTQRRVDANLRVHVFPVLGARPVADVRPSDVQAFVKALSQRLAPGTVRLVYATVRSVFRAAVLDRVITSSPCIRIALPAPGRKTLTIPDAETVHTLSRALLPHWRAVPIAAAGLGLRPAELFGLEVRDVDFLRRTVVVDRQLDEARQRVPLKTPSSYRTVPLPQVVADELARHLAAAGIREGLVFPGADGRPARLNTFTVAWRRVTAAHGQQGLRLHDLRHCYASALIAAGESVKTVQARMGHASAMVTLDVYGHLWPDSEERTRAAVDAWLAPAADSLRTVAASAQVSARSVDYLEKA